MTRLLIHHPIGPNQPLTLSGKADKATQALCHRVATVLRKKAGDSIILVQPQSGLAYAATLTECSPKRVILAIGDVLPDAPSPLPHLTLAAALIKGQRWDWLIQKATELGVSAIQPLCTEHTVVQWAPNDTHKLERWADIAAAAVEQCDGRTLPEILTPQPLTQWAQTTLAGQLQQHNHHGVVLMEHGNSRLPLNAILAPIRETVTHLTLVIGPEGGLTPTEAETLIEAGCAHALLGTRVLRAETAGMAALAAVVFAMDGRTPVTP